MAGSIRPGPSTHDPATSARIRKPSRHSHWQWYEHSNGMDRASIEEIADVLPPERAKPDRNVLLASLRGTRDMPSPDGRFSLETAKIANRVLSTVDPRMRSAKIDLVATFTNRFVDDAHAAIMRK